MAPGPPVFVVVLADGGVTPSRHGVLCVLVRPTQPSQDITVFKSVGVAFQVGPVRALGCRLHAGSAMPRCRTHVREGASEGGPHSRLGPPASFRARCERTF